MTNENVWRVAKRTSEGRGRQMRSLADAAGFQIVKKTWHSWHTNKRMLVSNELRTPCMCAKWHSNQSAWHSHGRLKVRMTNAIEENLAALHYFSGNMRVS